jgi:hypothetical protein
MELVCRRCVVFLAFFYDGDFRTDARNFSVNLGIATPAYEKAVAFVGQLTNVQKIKIITGQSFTSGNVSWNGYATADGVNGVNNHAYVSGFSTAAAVGMTWNPDLAQAQYVALGKV